MLLAGLYFWWYAKFRCRHEIWWCPVIFCRKPESLDWSAKNIYICCSQVYIFDDLQNSVAATKSGGAQWFFAESRKVGLIRQKHQQNKVCRARRDIRVTRKTRVEHNKHTSRVQNFNGFHIRAHSLRSCQLVSTKFHRLASLMFPMVPRWSREPRAIGGSHHFGMLLRSRSRGAR